MSAPLLLVHPGTHGVAMYARDVASAVRALRPAIRVVEPVELESTALQTIDDGTPVHAHFTDRLWGDSPEEAAQVFAALAARRPVSVTLHDLPQPSDGERNLPRRRAAYALVAAAARGVVVNSEHEHALLLEEDVWSGPITSIPLPVAVQDAGERVQPDDSVGVLGFFYPGKGHDEAAHAASAAGITRMTVLGRASDGHAADLEAFVRRAADLGVSVEVTGWLDDDEIARRGRAVSVPVIAHRHISASGSLASWIGWGRRPVAVRNRYIDEMAALRPGTLLTVDEPELAGAVSDAHARPETTWHGLERLPMSWPEVAEAYLQWWDGLDR
jgi:glycosyltransferase involved in cell wall biosynthesis